MADVRTLVLVFGVEDEFHRHPFRRDDSLPYPKSASAAIPSACVRMTSCGLGTKLLLPKSRSTYLLGTPYVTEFQVPFGTGPFNALQSQSKSRMTPCVSSVKWTCPLCSPSTSRKMPSGA